VEKAYAARRMAAIGVAGRSSRDSDRQKCPKRRVVAPRQGRGAIDSNLGVFGESKRVFNVYPEIAHGILDLAMTEQDLNGTKVARSPLDYRRLRSAKRVRAILASHETDTCYPFVAKRRVCRRISFTTRSAGAFVGDFFKEGWAFIFVLSSLRRSPNPP